MDGTFNQTAPLKRLVGSQTVYSVDQVEASSMVVRYSGKVTLRDVATLQHCTQGSKPPVSDYKRLCHRGFPLQTGQGKGLSYPFKCRTRPELGRYS